MWWAGIGVGHTSRRYRPCSVYTHHNAAAVFMERRKAARGWQRLTDKLDAAEVDLDGVPLELPADPFGGMYELKVM